GDAAKLTAGLRCAGLPWVHHDCTGRVLPAANFVSHRDLTEFFNSLLSFDEPYFYRFGSLRNISGGWRAVDLQCADDIQCEQR
ncbi:MAG: hypothetical protein K0U74_00405, partial [Alphaproteobacteria bacterium]|nr:hypothetical protein [Alphaproteobacteria bacterium]